MELGAHLSTAHELLRVTGYTPDPRQNRPLEKGPMARSQSLTSPSVPQAAGVLPSSPPSDRAPHSPATPAGLKVSGAHKSPGEGADMHVVMQSVWVLHSSQLPGMLLLVV